MSDENIYLVEKNGQEAMLYRVPEHYQLGEPLYENSHQRGQKPLKEWLTQWNIKKD